MDATQELPRITFRRLMVLVRGLSPNSAMVNVGWSRKEVGQINRPQTPQEAEAAFLSSFGKLPQGKAS